jgi:hypothetical protein
MKPHRTVRVTEQPSEGEGTEQDGPLSVSDDELPEDLQPSEDNPLAQPAGDDVPDDVLKDTSGRPGGDSKDASQGGGGASDASTGEASSESADADGDADDADDSGSGDSGAPGDPD